MKDLEAFPMERKPKETRLFFPKYILREWWFHFEMIPQGLMVGPVLNPSYPLEYNLVLAPTVSWGYLDFVSALPV